MRRNSRARTDDGTSLARFNRGMFFFFGPPKLGRLDEPAPAPIERDPVCPFCGHRESEHTVFRTSEYSRAECPTHQVVRP